jgi:hypothetical protein
MCVLLTNCQNEMFLIKTFIFGKKQTRYCKERNLAIEADQLMLQKKLLH